MKMKVDNVLRYIVKKYPNPEDLTKTRTTKLIYLVDWANFQKNGCQVTEINWYFDHYGPYVSDVFDTADEDRDLKISQKISNFGTKKYILESKIDKNDLTYELNEDEQRIIDKVIEDTKNLGWNQFIDHVYETAPVVNSNKYGAIDFKNFRI